MTCVKDHLMSTDTSNVTFTEMKYRISFFSCNAGIQQSFHISPFHLSLSLFSLFYFILLSFQTYIFFFSGTMLETMNCCCQDSECSHLQNFIESFKRIEYDALLAAGKQNSLISNPSLTYQSIEIGQALLQEKDDDAVGEWSRDLGNDIDIDRIEL